MHSGPLTNNAALPAKRTIARLLAASALILSVLLEAALANTDRTGLVLATLVGAPLGWFALQFVVWCLRKVNKIDVFSPFGAFPVVYGLWFGVGSLTFWENANPPRYDYFAMGFIAYLVGAVLIRWKAKYRQGAERWLPRIVWSESRFRILMLLFFLLMTVSYLVFVAQVGIPAIHADVAYRREAVGSHHYLGAIFQSSATTLMFFSAADLWSAKRVLPRFVSCGMLGLCALMLGSFGNKGFVIVPVLTLLILRHYWRKAIPAGRLAILFAGVFLASVAYDYTRAMGIANDIADRTWDEMLYSSGVFTLHTNLSNFRDIVEAIPSEVPYQHGYLTFGVLLQILPGHHESSDEFFRRILGSDFIGGGQPGTVLAPFYGDFGVTGILAGMFLFGAFSARVYRWMQEEPTLFRVLLYSWWAQTAILSVYGALVTYIITLWLPFLWWVLHRWMSTTPAEAGGLTDRHSASTFAPA